MSYIKESKENPFTLYDFSTDTKFSLRSKNNNCKICQILITNIYDNYDNNCSEVEFVVWKPLQGYGRHTICIGRFSKDINMKQLLIEISETFANISFEETECYIEVESKKRNFTF